MAGYLIAPLGTYPQPLGAALHRVDQTLARALRGPARIVGQLLRVVGDGLQRVTGRVGQILGRTAYPASRPFSAIRCQQQGRAGADQRSYEHTQYEFVSIVENHSHLLLPAPEPFAAGSSPSARDLVAVRSDI